MSNVSTQHIQAFCHRFLNQDGHRHKYLYWECMPDHLIDHPYQVKIEVRSLKWIGEPTYINGEFTHDEYYAKLPYDQFDQSAEAHLKVTFKTLLVVEKEHRARIRFRVRSYADKGAINKHIKCFTDYSETVDKYHQYVIDAQHRFKLVTIQATQFDGKTEFAFYTDIIRKDRTTQPANPIIGNSSLLEQITHAHGELAVCLSQMMVYLSMSNQYSGNRVNHEGKDLYLPNIGYYDHQLFMSFSVAVERLYTVWETLLVLLYNFDSLNIPPDKVSFGKYFNKAVNKIQSKSPMNFNPASENLQWLINFYKDDYQQIIRYRHRIVHHEFDEEHKGLLSAKYFINAYENVMNKEGIDKFESEIRHMPSLLIKHFNLCKSGFEKILRLIDELP